MKQKLKHHCKERALAVVALFLVTGLAVGLICPIVPGNAAAESFSGEVNTVVTGHIPSNLSVSLGENIDMTVAPSWKGSFVANQTTLRVATNNPAGYQIFLETADGTQNLNSTDTNNTQKITPIVGTASKNNFIDNINTWGYAFRLDGIDDNTEYVAIPTVGSSAVENVRGQTTGVTYNLGFAAIVSAYLPVGTYTNQVIVTVVAKPVVGESTPPETPPEIFDNVDTENGQGETNHE